jgi:phosphatidate cytidylyltransferase
MKRELAAAIAIPIVLAVLFLAPAFVFNLLVAVVALGALREFYRIAEKTGLPVAKTVGLAGGVAALSIPLLPRPVGAAEMGAGLLLLGALAAVAPLFAKVDLSSALGGAGATVFGVLAVALPATAMCSLRLVSPRAVLFLFVIVWGCDSFAYYTGKNFGRRKLAPRVSPNKTWEGTLGGLVGATAIGAAGGTWWLVPELGPLGGAVAGALASSAGQLGDLVESMWKRGAGVKDSGTFLPGHGGFYDRIDSLLFAGPVLLAVMTYFL